MGDHLKVDLGMLANVAETLKVLAREFSAADEIVDDHKRAIGAHELSDALDEFANNWKLHRKALLGAMEALQEMAESSHQTYVEVDSELARSIDTRSATAESPR